MAAAEITLRVESASGRKRVKVSQTAGLGELMKQISDMFGVPPEQQILSSTPLHNPTILDNNPNITISQLGLQHGSRVYLSLDDSMRAKLNEENKLQTWTKSKAVNVGMYADKWAEEKKPPKHLPFDYWMKKKQREYKNQPWNMVDLSDFDYRPVKTKGNKQLEMKSLPANAVLHKQQEYRHVDLLSFDDPDMINRFRRRWLQNPGVQRACLLFGTYEDIQLDEMIDGEMQKVDCVKASVVGLWEFNQEGHAHGVNAKQTTKKMLKKKRKVLEAMGYSAVGWLITTQERSDDNGEIFLTGDEIVQACKFQWAFRNENTNFSKFVTIVLHEEDTREPSAFMISDQGLAMIRDGIVIADPDSRGQLKVKEPEEGFYQPAVVVERTQIDYGKSFHPDVMLVSLSATRPESGVQTFEYVDVYHYCTKNNIFPSTLDGKILGQMLKSPQRRSLPYHQRLSDFLLLLLLPEFIDSDAACMLAKAVVERRKLTMSEKSKLDQIFGRF